MIINETLARAAFGDATIRSASESSAAKAAPASRMWKTVVGVVADVKARGPAQAAARPEFYLPLMQIPDVAWTWIGRSTRDR